MNAYVIRSGTYGDVTTDSVRLSADGAREDMEELGEGHLSDDELGELVEWDGQEEIEFDHPEEAWIMKCEVFWEVR